MDKHAKKAILICCIDYRHGDQIQTAINKVIKEGRDFFRLTGPGGAGLFAGLSETFPRAKEGLLEEIAFLLSHGIEELSIAVHGTSEEDTRECAGYKHGGYANQFVAPEDCRTFLHQELFNAAWFLRNKGGVTVPVRGFYITFTADGRNVAEEVFLET